MIKKILLVLSLWLFMFMFGFYTLDWSTGEPIAGIPATILLFALIIGSPIYLLKSKFSKQN